MPTLLQINVTANWGSTGRIAEEIGQTAMANGWESHIAYGRNANRCESNLIKVGCKYDVCTHYLRNRLFDGEGLGSKRATHKLIEQIKDLNPDIIHLHNIHDHWLNYQILFEYLADINTPIVWTFHDCWAFTGHCYHFENAACYKWQEQCEHCKLISSFSHDNSYNNYCLKRSLFSSLGKRLTIVPVSQWLELHVKQSFLKKCRIQTIHNGINIDLFNHDADTKPRKMILGVSNIWSESKGLSDFIKLRSLLPDDLEIVLVGLDKKQIANLPNGIIGMTRTSDVAELVGLYQSASVFVNLTRNDTFPTVNLESLACGTPVITYRTGGSPEAVDARTGIVVKKGDVEAIASACKEIIKAGKDKYSIKCRKLAEEYFDKRKCFQAYINLYNELLEI